MKEYTTIPKSKPIFALEMIAYRINVYKHTLL